jgi:RsiW-degrading membrane proteinase PrsW (M82 family)
MPDRSTCARLSLALGISVWIPFCLSVHGWNIPEFISLLTGLIAIAAIALGHYSRTTSRVAATLGLVLGYAYLVVIVASVAMLAVEFSHYHDHKWYVQ